MAAAPSATYGRAVTFRPELDTSVADWWLQPQALADWPVAQRHGPAGYAAYVRFSHLDDETSPEVLWLLLDDLAASTTTPDDVVVAQWEGVCGPCLAQWVDEERRRVVRSETVEHFLPPEVFATARVDRGGGDSYLLLSGPLADLGQWPVRADYPSDLREDTDFPEVVCGAMWPADRSWFYTWDMDDDHGATIACAEELAAALLADGRYAAWRVERGEPDPPERLRRD